MAIRKIWREFFVCLDLSEDILGGENNLKVCERSKTKLDLCLFKKLALQNNIFTRAFPLKNGWSPTHFLREKPWGRGWLHKTCFTWGGGALNKSLHGEAPLERPPLYPFYIPSRNPPHIPKLEHCIPFKCCKFTVFKIWKNHKPTLDFFIAINFF